MVDPNTGEETAEVPATDIPQSESQEQTVDQPEVQKQENPETDTGTNEVSDIPKENAAWAAQRVANKKLAEENERLKKAVSTVDPAYLETLRSAVSPLDSTPPQVPQVQGDAEYGQVTQNLNWAAQQAALSRQEVNKLRQQMELQQDREAERAFPELKSDKVFQQIVSEKKLAARMLGYDRTTYEIAQEVQDLLGKREEQVVAKATENATKQVLQRQAISSEPRGTTSGGRSTVTNDELRTKVRQGDSQAQTEVAKNIIADLEF
jgi:hypothetical protein